MSGWFVTTKSNQPASGQPAARVLDAREHHDVLASCRGYGRPSRTSARLSTPSRSRNTARFIAGHQSRPARASSSIDSIEARSASREL